MNPKTRKAFAIIGAVSTVISLITGSVLGYYYVKQAIQYLRRQIKKLAQRLEERKLRKQN